MQGTYRAICQYDDHEVYASWEVWYGEETESGWCGGLFELCESESAARRLAARLNAAGLPPVSREDQIPF